MVQLSAQLHTTNTELPFPRYIRKGKCVRCGVCCLNEDCEHLEFSKTGKAKCLIHKDPNRPSKCCIFPGNPPILFSSCGYYFIDRWDNGKKIRPGETV